MYPSSKLDHAINTTTKLYSVFNTAPNARCQNSTNFQQLNYATSIVYNMYTYKAKLSFSSVNAWLLIYIICSYTT